VGVYLSLLEPQAWFSTAMWVLAAILAATVIAAFFFSREITFAVTPLDFLIVFMVLSVPNLPGLEFDQQFVSRMLLQLIVVFYGTELVLAHTKSNVKLLRAVPVALLVVILVKTVG
jgi:UDP-GlcNAc:undecaprenyl-phosphate GlcNAc-1-phosphate transferase